MFNQQKQQKYNGFFIEFFDEINSTNTYLKRMVEESNCIHKQVIVADYQTQGRGRNAREWKSPKGSNICMSCLWEFKYEPKKLSGLSLCVGVAVVEAIKNALSINSMINSNSQKLDFQNLKIKWPNDIYIYGKKVAGILIETIIKSDKIFVIIGIGLNALKNKVVASVENSLSLEEAYQASINRENLFFEILKSLDKNLNFFSKVGFKSYQTLFNNYDFLYNKEIEVVVSNDKKYKGIAKGINDNGGLVLQTNEDNLKTRVIYSALKINY